MLPLLLRACVTRLRSYRVTRALFSQTGGDWLQYLAPPPLELALHMEQQKQERLPQNRTLGLLHHYANQLAANTCFHSHTVMVPRVIISAATIRWV